VSIPEPHFLERDSFGLVEQSRQVVGQRKSFEQTD
jgi:hypothetical protein